MLYKKQIQTPDYRIVSGASNTILNLFILSASDLKVRYQGDNTIIELNFANSKNIYKGVKLQLSLSGANKAVPFRVLDIEEIKENALYRLYGFTNTIWRYVLPWTFSPVNKFNKIPLYGSYLQCYLNCDDLDIKFDIDNPKLIVLFLAHSFEKQITKRIQMLEYATKDEFIWINGNYFIKVFDVQKINEFKLLYNGKFSELPNKGELLDFLNGTNVKMTEKIKQILTKDVKLKTTMESEYNIRIPDNQELHSSLKDNPMVLIPNDFNFSTKELPEITLKQAFDD